MGNERSASPFNLVFELEAGEPSETDLEAAGDVVLLYINDYLTMQFAVNDRTDLVETNGSVTGINNAEAQAFFALSLLFSDDSMFLPEENDIDLLIFAGFQQPFVSELLKMLESDLPLSNPLSATSNVILAQDE